MLGTKGAADPHRKTTHKLILPSHLSPCALEVFGFHYLQDLSQFRPAMYTHLIYGLRGHRNGQTFIYYLFIDGALHGRLLNAAAFQISSGL